MVAGQKSKRGKIEDLLCPFTDIYITQGSNEGNHLGTKAVDIRGIASGVKYAFYAPCECVCFYIIPENGQSHWTSVNKVRTASGKIDYITFLIAHDNSFNAYVGQKLQQGEQLGNMGDLGYATGVHTHIEVAIGSKVGMVRLDNKYQPWTFKIPAEIEFEEAFFMDNTNIIRGKALWKFLDDIKVIEEQEEQEEQEEGSNDKNNYEQMYKEQLNINYNLKKELTTCYENSKLDLLAKINKDGFYGIKLKQGEELYLKKSNG